MLESSTDEEALPGTVAESEIQGGDTGQDDSSTQADSSAESAPANSEDGNKPKDMAAAVRAALDLGKEHSSGSGENEDKPKEASEEGEAKAKPNEEEELGPLTDEELNSYKGKTRRRFKQLDGQNKALSAQLEQFKPMAELGSAVKGMAEKANLTREDLNTGFKVMDLMKNNPIQAYEVLTPIYKALCDIVGVGVMPDDLQQQLNEGKITPERASELSRLRAAAGFSAARKKSEEERDAKAVQADRVNKANQLAADVGTAVSDWETRWKKADPDYAHKQSRVLDAIDLELMRRKESGKLPTSVKEAIDMCNTVKAKVDAELKKLLPKRNTPITQVAGNGAMNGSKPVATTSRDAIAQALGHH